MDLIKRNKFWVASGCVALVGVILFAVLGVPAYARNNKVARDLTADARKLTEANARPSVPNPKWVEQAKQQGQALEAQLGQAQALFQGRDAAITQPFVDPQDPKRTVESDPGIWKDVYAQKVADLLALMKDSFTVLGSQPFVSKDYRGVVPDPPEMASATTDYLVQYNIINAIARLNRKGLKPAVPVFQDFRFDQQPDRLLQTQGEKSFRPIAFEVELSCQFQNVPMVLTALLNIPQVDLYVTALTVSRRESSTGTGAMVRPGLMGPAPGAVMGPRGAAAMGMGVPSTAGSAGESVMGPRGRAAAMAAGGAGMIGWMPEEPLGPVGPVGPVGPGVAPSGAAAALQPQGKEGTAQAALPPELVQVVVRGYVADYSAQEKSKQQPQPAGAGAPPSGPAGAAVKAGG